jgi:transcriptional regulator with XRE-family HTH domain
MPARDRASKKKVDLMARRKQAETEQEGQDFTQAMLDLGIKIREARKRAGLNQIELADAAGLAASYVHEMEAVGANLTFKAFLKIAACLKVSLRDLMPDNGFEAELSPNLAELSAILRLTASGLEAHLASDLRRALEHVVAKKS